nr:alpha/beta fold hydrolase [Corynebacterium lactis]
MNDYLTGKRVPGPALRHFPVAYARSLRHPEWVPSGARDVREVLAEAPFDTPDGEVPVVLIHGTWMNSFDTFTMLAPALAEGRTVYSLDYGADPNALVSHVPGVYGSTDLAEAFEEVSALLDAFRAHIGARRIDLVGHSQGALHCRIYANAHIDSLYDDTLSRGLAPAEAEEFAAANSPVRAVVSLAGNHHGTSGGIAYRVLKPLDRRGVPVRGLLDRIFGRAGAQQSLHSVYITGLNKAERGLTRRGPHYLNIGTPFDTVVTPWNGEFLPETAGHDVRNVNNADSDGDWSDHLAILYSPNAIRTVVEYLDDMDSADNFGGGAAGSTAGSARAAGGDRRPPRVLPFVGALPRARMRVQLRRKR